MAEIVIFTSPAPPMYRQACDWCEREYVGGRVPEYEQVGHGKLCMRCEKEVKRIAAVGSAASPGLEWLLMQRQAGV